MITPSATNPNRAPGRRDVGAWGVTFDLTITIPLLYWFFVVRPGHARPLTLATLFVVCTMVAALMIPRSQQFFLHDLKYLVALLEVVLVATLVRRIRRGEGVVAGAVASEITILYYAFFGWGKRAEEVNGHAVTFHERSGWGSIVACAIVLIAAEGIAAHLFLSTWSTKAAWAWTALDLWGMAWLIGDYHALRLRRSCLRIAMLDEPRWLVTLREPVVVHGIMGIRKAVRALALRPDDDQFISAVRSASDPDSALAARR